jgi:hypothetical protein
MSTNNYRTIVNELERERDTVNVNYKEMGVKFEELMKKQELE